CQCRSVLRHRLDLSVQSHEQRLDLEDRVEITADGDVVPERLVSAPRAAPARMTWSYVSRSPRPIPSPAGVRSPRSRCESADPPAPPRSSWPRAGYHPDTFSGSASREGNLSSPGGYMSLARRPADWLRLARGRTGCFAGTARPGRSRSP